MSGSDRRLVAAFIAVTCFGVGAGATTLVYAQQKHEETVAANAGTNQQAAPNQQSATERAGLPGALETYISNPEPADKPEAERRNLAAQEAAAVGSLWAAIIAGVALLVTTAGTVLLFQQIILTREAVKDTGDATKAMHRANEIAKQGQRPWLTIEFEVTRFVADERKFEAHYTITVSNIGKTIASEFLIKQKVYPYAELFPEGVRWQYAQWRRHKEAGTGSLLPGEVFRTHGITTHSIEHAPWFGKNLDTLNFLGIVGVYYTAPLGDDERVECRTERSFRVGLKNTDVMRELHILRGDLKPGALEPVIRINGPGFTT